jgi:hypothetical protein
VVVISSTWWGKLTPNTVLHTPLQNTGWMVISNLRLELEKNLVKRLQYHAVLCDYYFSKHRGTATKLLE